MGLKTMQDFVGKKLGNFEVVKLIGKGGMAAVYQGFQPSMNRAVAIKVLAPQFSVDENFVRRFKNEAQMIAQLEHKHILPVYDFGDEDGILFIVMRHLEGGILEDLIVPGGMELIEVYKYFSQVASALHYAHTKGVVHRDLKPSNVLIDDQGDSYLMDFGIAKIIEGSEKLTGTGAVVGTPTYMAPEQCAGEEADSRMDVYALGVMLFEMLTGKPPFTAANPMAVMLRHVNDPAPAPSEFRPGLNPAIDAVVLQALAKKPDERYQTVAEFVTAFRDAVLAATGVTPDTLVALDIATEHGAAPIVRPAGSAPETEVVSPTAPGAIPQAAAPPIAVAAPALAVPIIPVTLNAVSSWLNARAALGTWLEGLLLSVATFFLLTRLTGGSVVESAALALIPGLVLYGLLRAPTLGGLLSFVLILIPLLIRAPGVALLWTIVLIAAAWRLHSHEILLMLVVVWAAGHPFGWLVPLLAPWWLKARKTTLPMALGVGLAILMAMTMSWADGGGLLIGSISGDTSQILLGAAPTSYLTLFEPSTWPQPQQLGQAILATMDFLRSTLLGEGGQPLMVMVSWSLATVLSVSNRRSPSPYLRPIGLVLGLVSLVLPIYQTAPLGALALGLLSVFPAFLLSQWPIQADPNKGNYPSTILRLLRQSLGALFLAAGVTAYMQTNLGDSILYIPAYLGAVAGVTAMVSNPLLGALLTFFSLAVGVIPIDITQGLVLVILLAVYMLINLFLDRRRPRGWNPIGAGALIGAPGLASAGLMPMISLSMGALETQIPAAIFSIAAYITLWMGHAWSGAAIVTHIVMALVGILLVERLMDVGLLKKWDGRSRRLLFTLVTAGLLAFALYGFGEMTGLLLPGLSLVTVLLVNLIFAGVLVASMGERGSQWQAFIEPEPEEVEEETTVRK